MKESYGEEIANHADLESCGCGSNVAAEALTEAGAGQPLSFEISKFRVPTVFSDREGHTGSSVNASCFSAWRSRRPWHASKLLARNPGGPVCGLAN